MTGQATAEVDLLAALAAYRAAVEQARTVDNRLFLGLAGLAADPGEYFVLPRERTVFMGAHVEF